MPIIAISMAQSDLEELERLQTDGGFANRSDLVRHAIQSLLADHRTLEGVKGDVAAICTVFYSLKGKDMQCHHIQHEYSHMLEAMMHAHTNGGGCIEVMIVKGAADYVRSFIKSLRKQRKVTRVEVILVDE